jgi:putative transposase
MRKSRFSEEQIIQILKAAEAGQKVADLVRKHGISEYTFYRWRAKSLNALRDQGRGGVGCAVRASLPRHGRGRTAREGQDA